MPLFTENYLVIDYGSTHIKGALYQANARGLRLLRVETLPIIDIQAEEGPDGGAAAIDPYEYNLVRYVQSFFPEELNFILNLPLERVYVRDVSIPVVNAKQLQEVIPHEVETMLPVSLEDAEVIGQAWEVDEENSNVISFTAERQSLMSAVLPLRRPGTSVRMISIDSVGLANFLRLLPPDDYAGTTVGQIDIGGRYTIFNVVRGGSLVFTRQLPFGGEDITQIVGETLHIKDRDAAEQKKLDLEIDLAAGRVEKPDSFFRRNRVEPAQYAKIIKKSEAILRELTEEIDRSILSLPCEPPDEFYASGGASLMGGVRERLEKHLGRRLREYPLELGHGESASRWATVIGTAEHYRLKSGMRFDFLQSPFGSQLKGGAVSITMFWTPIIILMAGVVLFLVGAIGDVWKDQTLGKKYRAEAQRVAQEIPGLRFERTDGPPELEMAARRLCNERLASQGKDVTSLDVLAELTRLTPSPSEVPLFRVKSVKYNEQGIELRAEVGSFEDISTVTTRYSESQIFGSPITPRNQRRLPDGSKVEFTLTIPLGSTGAATVSCD